LIFDFWFPLSCTAAAESAGDVARVASNVIIKAKTNTVDIVPFWKFEYSLSILGIIVHIRLGNLDIYYDYGSLFIHDIGW
jgi:hypothetical protein